MNEYFDFAKENALAQAESLANSGREHAASTEANRLRLVASADDSASQPSRPLPIALYVVLAGIVAFWAGVALLTWWLA